VIQPSNLGRIQAFIIDARVAAQYSANGPLVLSQTVRSAG
jgi:hypothetical protein